MRQGHVAKRRRGHAVIEVVLLAPWIFFLFIGTLDMGFVLHAMISTQNAARAAAAYTSRYSDKTQDSIGACQYARAELQAMSNVRNLSNCDALPLLVTAQKVTGPDGANASSVSVSYRTMRLIPIPGLSGQFTITRKVQMRVK